MITFLFLATSLYVPYLLGKMLFIVLSYLVEKFGATYLVSLASLVVATYTVYVMWELQKRAERLTLYQYKLTELQKSQESL